MGDDGRTTRVDLLAALLREGLEPSEACAYVYGRPSWLPKVRGVELVEALERELWRRRFELQ